MDSISVVPASGRCGTVRDLRILECAIKVGASSRNPLHYMRRAADLKHPGWFGIEAERFRCRSCGIQWEASPEATSDLAKVSCSNCYSDNVLLTAMSVEMWTGPTGGGR